MNLYPKQCLHGMLITALGPNLRSLPFMKYILKLSLL